MDSISKLREQYSINNPSGLDSILYTNKDTEATTLLVPGIRG